MTDTPTRPPLSDATQAVWDAAWQLSPLNCQSHQDRRRQQIAAALRAAVAATQMRQYGDCWICDADELLAIATNLENAS